MLNITNKTTRADLIFEIQSQRIDATRAAKATSEAITALEARVAELNKAHAMKAGELAHSAAEANANAEHAERRCELLAEDVSNLLGTIRVLSDPQRPIRIRLSTVQPSDIATALPRHNTDKF